MHTNRYHIGGSKENAMKKTLHMTTKVYSRFMTAKSASLKKSARLDTKSADYLSKDKNVKTDGMFTTVDGYFKIENGTYAILKRNIIKKANTLILGPTGVGKTEVVTLIAQSLKLPITIFDMGTMSDPIMSLVGTHIINITDGKTESRFAKSRFSEMIQQPGVILLDELSRSSPTANNLLFPCLDFRRELSMEYCFEDCSPIPVHPDCVFFATANVGGQYTGTHKLDRALTDRFMVVEMDPLDATRVKEVLEAQYSISIGDIDKLVSIFTKINTAHDAFTISFNLSIRHLKMVAEMVEDKFTIYDSFYAICKGIGSKEGLKSLEAILNTAKEK